MNYYIIPGLKGRKLIAHPSIEISFKEIIEIVLANTGKTEEDIIARDRRRETVELRMICMWTIKRNTTVTLQRIADYFKRDHTSVIHSLRTINDLIYSKDKRITGIIDRIKNYL